MGAAVAEPLGPYMYSTIALDRRCGGGGPGLIG